MANTRELRRRIRSVKNTAQITKAMQMVAATKMRRAQAQALAGRPYTENLNNALVRLTSKVNAELNKLLQANEAKESGVILLSTDKSLCGALNTNLFRSLLNFAKETPNLKFFTVGRKGRQFLVNTSKDLQADFENPEIVTFRQAKQLARLVTQSFLSGELKEIYIAYPDFVSTLRQEPRIVKLLPVNPDDLKTQLGDLANRHPGEAKTSIGSKTHQGSTASLQNDGTEFLFEPNPSDLLDFVLAHSIETKIYQALLETKASEWSARMMAMQNATDNAKELVDDLQLSYNQTRQAAITNELLEITTAQAALE